MKLFQTAALAAFFVAATCVFAPGAKADAIRWPLPPLKVAPTADEVAPAGDWSAPASALDYAATRKAALTAEKSGKTAAALTAWERVIDRTVCDDDARAEARAHIKTLRPKVAVNTDPEKAKKWNVLALVFMEVDFTPKGSETKHYRQTMTGANLDTIAKELAAWRDLAFEFSSGQILLDIDAVIIDQPVTELNYEHNGFVLSDRVAARMAKEAASKKKYDTVIYYIKHRAKARGAEDLKRPRFTAATFARSHAFNGAGFIMIPWGEDYPFVPREAWGEMELHEWLHQVDALVQGRHSSLGYPKGVAQNPDNGGKDNEYVREKSHLGWSQFYRHIMAEHITRQVWTELAVHSPTRPGKVISTEGSPKK